MLRHHQNANPLPPLDSRGDEMKGFDFDVFSFAYDLCLLSFAVWAAGTAILWTVRYFIETIVPGYDPTGYKKRMNDYVMNKIEEDQSNKKS